MPREVDDYAAGKITEATEEIFEGQEIRHFVFDFRITTFMDSSGIGVIIGRSRKMKFLDGELVVCGVTPRIERIFEASGLYKIVKVRE